MAYCECGCGAEVKNRFVSGHNYPTKSQVVKEQVSNRLKYLWQNTEIFTKRKIPLTRKERTNHSGGKYNKWTIVKKVYVKDHQSYYLAKCECGKEKISTFRAIKSSYCCWKCSRKIVGEKERLPYGETSRNTVLSIYRSHAKKRNLEWGLTDEETLNIMNQNCYYCGRTGFTINKRGVNGFFIYNGIDRLDNNIGYVRGNCVPCCIDCNRAKHTMSEEQFLNLIKLIYNKRIRRNNKRCEYISREWQKMAPGELFPVLQ